MSYDEALLPDGRPRDASAAALAAVAGKDPAQLEAAVRGRLERAGVQFVGEDGDSAFPLDPVPRVLTAEEWHDVKVGLAQRVKALNAFVADAYGARSIVKAGIVPARVIETADHYEPAMQGVTPPGGQWIGVAGLDVVRDPEGEFRVLEDNLMTPSGFSYAVAAREAVLPELEPPAADVPRGFDELPALLAGALEAASPGDGLHVVLTDGPENGAHWEHAWAAAALGLPLVEPGELRVESDVLYHGSQRVAVVYRRTNADLLDTPVGALLDRPLRAGTLGLVNAFGTGVADDKLTQAYVEDMVRFYLGEEPLLRSVPTYDLARAFDLREALDRFGELVIKPRSGSGGRGVVINPHAKPEDVEAVRRAVVSDPGAWVAQPMICLSTHPTVIDGRLQPRHVDLRPFVLGTAAGPRMAPAALTRVAFDPGALVVNTSQNGGGKDTWVPVG
jgi:uncharacterized circularly permuted ATP-grasp superfamily protein